MIINIPLQIDEERMEEVLQKDYEGKVLDEITKYIKATLSKQSSNYYGDKVIDGMQALIENRIDIFLDEHKEEIIETAAKELANKLARSKKGKELLEVCK